MIEATGMLQIGEKWLKNRGIEREGWKVFLKKQRMDTTIFNKGIPSMTLKSKWMNFLLIIQKFVSCEGTFGCMYFYHIRLLMNFMEENEINLPYFLLNSLRNMSRNVQSRIQFIDNSMYHHGLVKICIEFHLQNIGDNWESFLVRNYFKGDTHGLPNRSIPKRGREKN